jgi:hypothetical protein
MQPSTTYSPWARATAIMRRLSQPFVHAPVNADQDIVPLGPGAVRNAKGCGQDRGEWLEM